MGVDSAVSRPLTDLERAILARLLSVPFPGRDELRAQVPGATVAGGCRCGCATVDLATDRSAAPAPVSSTMPVGGDFTDGGILLFVDRAGYLSLLEIYSFGDEPLRRFPAAEQVSVFPSK